MNILFALAILAAADLIFLLFSAVKSAPPNVRKAFLVPGLLQIFAAALILSRGKVIPGILPSEVTTLLCYFFSLYLTFTLAKRLFSENRKLLSSLLWGFCAAAFWILSLCG